MEVNLFGAWRTTMYLAPMMRRGGRVVNVSSGAGSFAETAGTGATPAYSIGKAALNILAVELAADLRNRRILVNAVCAGGLPPTWAVAADVRCKTAPPAFRKRSICPTTGPSAGFFRDGEPVPW